MSDTIWAAIISGSVGLIGVGFGLWWNRDATKKAVDLSFKKAEKLIYKQDFLKAAAEFESVFTEEMFLLETPATTNHGNSAQAIINNSAVKHKNAMIRFRPHVIESDRSSFDNAWNDYKDAGQYSTKPHDKVKQKAQRNRAIEKINKLLDFAK